MHGSTGSTRTFALARAADSERMESRTLVGCSKSLVTVNALHTRLSFRHKDSEPEVTGEASPGDGWRRYECPGDCLAVTCAERAEAAASVVRIVPNGAHGALAPRFLFLFSVAPFATVHGRPPAFHHACASHSASRSESRCGATQHGQSVLRKRVEPLVESPAGGVAAATLLSGGAA